MNKNNFYGYVMSKSLPTSNFNCSDSTKFNLDKYDDDSLRGCVLGVDLEYLKELLKLYNDYSLAADTWEIKKEMLPDY